MADELVTVPADLTLVSDDDLQDLETQAVAEFDRLKDNENVDPDEVQYLARLTEGIDHIRSEKAGRVVRRDENARLDKARLSDTRATLTKRVHGDDGGSAGNGGDGGEHSRPADLEAIAEASARGTVAAFASMLGQRSGPGVDVASMQQKASAALSAARQHAPAQVAPRARLAVTAGVDIPGVARGHNMGTLDEMVDAFQRAAKGMPITRGNPQERLVATIRNEYEHVVDDRTSASQVEELLKHLRRPEKMQSLVAGGGWCAPSEIRYEFFNVAGVDGLADLPTVGISRGGLQFPVSPSIADAFGTKGLAPFAVAFTNASVPWLWTEADDASSVTGTPTKPTIRVPCPTFTNVRLECYGITMTAGNLTDDAYPEATANTLRLLLAAWQHAQNARIIQQMVNLSGAAITGIGGAGAPVFQTIMNGLDLACTDYRTKYAIPDETPLEVVIPFWVQDLVAADLAWRPNSGDAMLNVSNQDIARYLATRNVRAQFVNDWQVRGTSQFGNPTTPLTAWPTTCDVLVFAAGTFVKGNGLTLDLGVVRDSTLNATNDFTAAWSEECHLVARVGHESRRYTFVFGVTGATGGSAYALGSPTARI